ncbi:hypothetical protein BGZ82_002840 [Podila clonocystis]|nr:hypothetical protein BGZ82_002840 [Podila clonocystis]
MTTCISYWMIGLNSDIATFFKFLLILVPFNISTALFCLAVATGVRTTGVGSLTGQIPRALTWTQYLSMFRCGFEALAEPK